jgi:lipopolysaccharide transport system ATP-binding protein
MSQQAIVVENLTKCYRIQHQAERYPTFRDVLTRAATAPWRRFRQLSGRTRESDGEEETFWALKGASFEVGTGEVIGLIGRNGAGKSTLLKILSRITEPTSGRAVLQGRVASLLEVGTGFHPELTGRENIYLNGSILGMKRAEIREQFDEIVAFSGVEKFLDTPVKRYSSGMYVRLAFAVAAHLNPEILLVDEVLAVGDAEFQRKCLGRIRDVATSGRTVLFVSHNMVSVESLCHRAILLDVGEIVDQGPPSRVVGRYLSALRQGVGDATLADRPDRTGNGDGRYTKVRFFDGGGQQQIKSVPVGQELIMELEFTCRRPVVRPGFQIVFVNSFGQDVFHVKTYASMDALPEAGRGGVVCCRFPALNVIPGLYTVTLILNDAVSTVLDYVPMAASIEVTEADVCGTGRVPYEHADLVYMPARWSVDYQ